MPISKLSAGDCLSLLASHLATERYCCSVTKNYLAAVKRFLQYAEGTGLGIETVQRPDIEHYLCTLRLFRKRRLPPPRYRRSAFFGSIFGQPNPSARRRPASPRRPRRCSVHQ